MRKYILICFIGIWMQCSTTSVFAKQPSHYAIQANIIYHFTKYIDWPESKKTGDFTIGIVGETPLYNELSKLVSGKKVGNQKIVIKRFSSSSAAFNCHILFISDDETNSVKRISTNTNGSSVLLVSESEGLARRGSCINFSIVDERMKLEINKNNIQERNLSVANELLKLAILIK